MNDLIIAIAELEQHAEAVLHLLKTLKELANNQEQPEVTQLKLTTLEEVRAVLAEKSRAGHTDAIRDLLIKHGAKKLSEIDPEKYPLLLSDAEALEDG